MGGVSAAEITVVVWVRQTANYPAIRDELLGLAADCTLAAW